MTSSIPTSYRTRGSSRTALAVLFACASFYVRIDAQETNSRTGPGAADSVSEAKTIELTPFTVTAESNTGYGALTGTSGRLAQAYIDIPQATSIVTSELLRDTNTTTSFEATMFVPNVNAGASHAINHTLRGIRSFAAVYTDGFASASPVGGDFDLAFVDRIEVVRGPSSNSFGRGNPAGFINYILKRPTRSRSTEATVTFGAGGGSTPHQRYVLDNNGLLTDNGNTAYRFVGFYHRGSDTPDHSEFARGGVMLSLEHLFPGRGVLSFSSAYQSDHNPGLVIGRYFSDRTMRDVQMAKLNNTTAFPLADPDTTFGLADRRAEIRSYINTISLDYKLTEAWSTRQSFQSHAVVHDFLWGVFDVINVGRDASGELVLNNGIASANESSLRGWAYQSDFVWEKEMGFLNSRHTLLFGGDYSEDTNLGIYDQTLLPPQPVNGFNFNIPHPLPAKYNVFGPTDGPQYSWYAQLGSSLWDGKLQPTVAFRRLYFDRQTKFNGTTIAINKNKTPLFGTYSLLYKLRPWLSLYAVKSKYQEPLTVVRRYDPLPNPSDPRNMETVNAQPTTDLSEFGIKGNLFGEKIVFSANIFRISGIL